jgi:hypothetical protein
MQEVYQHYNTDDVFNRSVISGLLYLLNHEITYTQVWEDKVTENVTVPFAYNFVQAKDQRFVQDNYTFFGRECFSDKLIDGKFDMCPRFAVTYTGSNIDSANITNRFVKGEFVKEVDGKITTYLGYMYVLPLTLNFDVEGWIDNLDTAFKLEQTIRETFYKNRSFNVLYKGVKVPCCVGFPESYNTTEKIVSYSFEQDPQLLKMNFTLAVECYQPCFDETTAIPAETKIERFGFDPNVYNGYFNKDTKHVELEFIDFENRVYSTGETVDLKWRSRSNTSDVYTVILYYITSDGDKHIIDVPMASHNIYSWKIPTTLSNFKQPSVVFIDDEIEVVRQPSVTVVPDSSGNVGTDCFFITDPGEFSGTGYVQVSCEYIDSKGAIKIHDCYVAEVDGILGVKRILYYTDVPEMSYPIQNTKKLKYKKNSFYTPVTLGISYSTDPSIFNEIHNVLIV